MFWDRLIMKKELEANKEFSKQKKHPYLTNLMHKIPFNGSAFLPEVLSVILTAVHNSASGYELLDHVRVLSKDMYENHFSDCWLIYLLGECFHCTH